LSWLSVICCIASLLVGGVIVYLWIKLRDKPGTLPTEDTEKLERERDEINEDATTQAEQNAARLAGLRRTVLRFFGKKETPK